ncbi:MAG: cob(I)yrinic acid a,c-diamide adenosyltransferase [Cytophagaceae bacterium]|nr:cob(I)yrinic acid a,c-diamide adenosyltransferase [Cytophagaceae bacterium]MBK9934618.1 cob(I)yrinic acid a,c-diamide adenosyltransferase [Cytophagaceae bacterium]MBL0301057.1 cob(I)yrinic acid a,c-diamide adenosyltransferase [Cytophagaceae bacterium]MBL0323876.1 cob(I)yrinic acid a,c-diamide adenosyltransferase [Cytophagaceae bacterium]
MSKIYTKTGDKGTTSLVGGTRLDKDHIKIEAYGTVDELNSWMGVIADFEENKDRKNVLKEIQDRLFTIGADLASEPEFKKKTLPILYESDVELLEKQMDEMNDAMSPIRHFILPGGHQLVSFTHVARTVCRRAERKVISLSKIEETNPKIVIYLNRLSDFLFVLSRKITSELGIEEVKWTPR